MRRFLTRALALALVLVFAMGMVPMAFADQDVRIRDTAYSETLGLRVAMSGAVSDTAIFAVTGPDGALTITAAAMNLLISILAVNRLGLVGVAIGTLCAMIYQTGWMAFYNIRRLLKRPLGSVIRQFAVDIAAAAITILCCSGYSLGECSYYGWLILAVKTGCTAFTVSASIWFAFYRKPILAVLRHNK